MFIIILMDADLVVKFGASSMSILFSKQNIILSAQRCAPEFTESLTDLTSQVGDDQVVLQCRLCGLPLPRITWYHNATLLRDRVESAQSFDGDVARLALSSVSLDHAGEYQCVARNVSGEARTVCQLTVQGMLVLVDVLIWQHVLIFHNFASI